MANVLEIRYNLVTTSASNIASSAKPLQNPYFQPKLKCDVMLIYVFVSKFGKVEPRSHDDFDMKEHLKSKSCISRRHSRRRLRTEPQDLHGTGGHVSDCRTADHGTVLPPHEFGRSGCADQTKERRGANDVAWQGPW